MTDFLPTLRKQTGQNATVSDVVRHSIAFALKHRAQMIAELINPGCGSGTVRFIEQPLELAR
jgi:23S rRNA G2445 N2-methylase RlmL